MKTGIITFHNSYNCGSMLESYAIHKYLKNVGVNNEIVDYSNEGQKELYSIFSKNNSIKNVVKNVILLPHFKRLSKNNMEYENFKIKNFSLSSKYNNSDELNNANYSLVVAGSDQIWNITIKDSDDCYFLPWANNSRRVAYAPSFGAKKISDYTDDEKKYKDFLLKFDALSIRENNGKRWIQEMINKDVPVLIDPTLLLDANEYDAILDNSFEIPYEDYIFFYCPRFNKDICKFMKKISKKYKLPVIAWSARNYYLKGISRFGFKLPEYESPAVYLKLIKNAKIVFTTSFHGTIFSTIYRKNFYTIKNGEMYGNDDRVITLLDSLKMQSRLIPYDFDDEYNYLTDVDYSKYEIELPILQEKAKKYIEDNIVNYANNNLKEG